MFANKIAFNVSRGSQLFFPRPDDADVLLKVMRGFRESFFRLNHWNIGSQYAVKWE